MNDERTVSWHRSDIEQRIGFQGGRFTRVNGWFAGLFGLILAVLFYAILAPFSESAFGQMFTERGLVPYAIVVFSAVTIVILFVKWRKLAFQRTSLSLPIVPTDPDFVLSIASAHQIVEAIQISVDDLKKFVLFNRIDLALSNLKNLGRVTDVDEILRSQSDNDESVMETSYSLLRGLIWAIPVLGFIGTVLGLSTAIGNFGSVLSNTNEVSEIANSLKSVTGGLATAFETTLEALVAALGLQFMVTMLKKSEEEFLDECSEYCQRNIVGKLRIMPFQTDHVDESQE